MRDIGKRVVEDGSSSTTSRERPTFAESWRRVKAKRANSRKQRINRACAALVKYFKETMG